MAKYLIKTDYKTKGTKGLIKEGEKKAPPKATRPPRR